MKEQTNPINYALKFGLKFGIVMIVFNLIKYIFKLEGESVWVLSMISFTNFLITVVAISAAIFYYRKNAMDGYITYGHAISFSMSFMFFAALASGVVSFIYFQWIDSFYLGWRMGVMKETILDFYYSMNVSEDIIDTVEDMFDSQEVPSPFSALTGQIMSDVFRGFIVALIAAIFLQKKPLLFDKTSE